MLYCLVHTSHFAGTRREVNDGRKELEVGMEREELAWQKRWKEGVYEEFPWGTVSFWKFSHNVSTFFDKVKEHLSTFR